MSILGSLLGGAIKSKSTSKAKDALVDAAGQAKTATTDAANNVIGLNAPGVDLYGRSINALSARSGLGGDLGATGAGGGAAPGGSPGTYGDTANPTLTMPTAPNALNVSAGAFQESPGFQFALDRGLGAINSNFASRGALNSGAALKGLAGFATGLANQEYGDWRDYTAGRFDKDRAQYNTDRTYATDRYDTDRSYLTDRYDQQTDDLTGLADLGGGAVTTTGNALTRIGTAGADAANAVGQARAGSALQKGNIWSGTAGDIDGQIAKALSGLVG